MKRNVLVLIYIVVIAAIVLAMTGCTKSEDPYAFSNYGDCVKLPDYDSFEYKEPQIRVTEADVQKEIEKRLKAAATEEVVYEGVVEEGDKINIKFDGTLVGGFSLDSLDSENYTIENLGHENMIDGFQEGIIGHKVGDNFVLNLKFPDPYYSDATLSGLLVDFDITILSKTLVTPKEYDVDFFKESSNGAAKDKEAYEAWIKNGLEEADINDQLKTLTAQLYDKIVEETEITASNEELEKYEYDKLLNYYRLQAKKEGYEDDFATFIKGFFYYKEDEFYKMLEEYSKNTVQQKFLIYSLADKEDVKVSEKEYSKKKQEIFDASQLRTEEAFEEAYGLSLDDYCEIFNARENLLLEKTLHKIYERNMK